MEVERQLSVKTSERPRTHAATTVVMFCAASGTVIGVRHAEVNPGNVEAKPNDEFAHHNDGADASRESTQIE